MQSVPQEHAITDLLHHWREGANVMDELMPLVYEQLRSLAWKYHGAPSGDVTIRPTMLVHEAYLRLQSSDRSFNDRNHFYAAAALTMRRLLIDFARHKQREKRGAGVTLLEFDEDRDTVHAPATGHDIVALNDALEQLQYQDERKARIIELHFFAGLDYAEIAEVMGLSLATVGRELKFSRAWLAKELSEQTPAS